MADSDDDYESHKRHGTQSGRNKFRKERDDLDDSSSKLTSSSSMSSRDSGSGTLNSINSSRHRYASARRPDRSYSSPSRNERSSPPPSMPRRNNNGFQQQHHYGTGGAHYNSSSSSNRYDYGAFNSNNNRSHDENGFKRSRSSYESSYSNNSYNSNNNYDNSFYDSSASNKKLRRDWSVLEGASSHNSKYYEHDNRTDLDDLSDELAPHEYTRLNRPSNYSSYSEFHPNNGAPNYYNNNYANMPFNNPMHQQQHHHHHHHHASHHQSNHMMMGFRNQFGNNFSNNIPPAYMQPMYPAMQQPAPFLNPMLTNFNSDYDGQTQPQMLSFKQFMAGLQAENNDMSISQEAAMKRYNDYKNAFRREQISLFYAAHKNEDWFRCRYHPDDSARRKDEQRESIRRRLKIFLGLVEKYCKKENEEDTQDAFDLSLDATNEIDRQNLYKFIDAVIIKLEDGSDEDLGILEEIYSKSVETTTRTAALDNTDVTETSKSNTQEEQIKEEEPMNIEKHKVSDDESGMGSNDNSDDEDEEEDDEANKGSVDSKFDRKKKSKRTKKSKNEPDATTKTEEDEKKLNGVEANEETQMQSSEEKKEETVSNTKLETTKASPSVSTTEKSKPSIPHKTQSIFFKHLPVNVTRQDLEEIGRKFAGFKRAAISEPAPERRFQRRGWISYDSSVDIKEICTKINGLKLHDMLLNATINREIDQKVKCIIGFTNDKAIVRNDLKLIAKVVDNMDRRWGLWQYNDLYSNNKLNDDEFKLTYDRKKSKENSKKKSTESADVNAAKLSESKSESSIQDENTDSKLSDSTSEQASETPAKEEPQVVSEQQQQQPADKVVLAKNPFVEEANEYLKYLSELKEENRGDDADLKDLVKSPQKKTDEEDTTITDSNNTNEETSENNESSNEKTVSKTEDSKTKPPLVSLNKTFKLEKDLKAAKLLDRLILYLRIVHSIDYYNVTEYQQEDWMPNRCGIIHGRGSSEIAKTSTSSNTNIVNILNGIHINYFDANALKKVQIDEWLRLFEASIKSYVDYRERIDLEIARRLGLKDLPVEIEKFITSNCQKVEKDIWLCPLSGKKFKGPDYVRKHIETKHRERLLELRRDVEYFNRFVLDPKRPYLPEHPLTKNASMMSNQTPGGGAQMSMPYSDYYRPNMYPGMAPNMPFNQYPQSPYQPFNSQKILSNQFSPYPMYNQSTQPQYSSHKPRR